MQLPVLFKRSNVFESVYTNKRYFEWWCIKIWRRDKAQKSGITVCNWLHKDNSNPDLITLMDLWSHSESRQIRPSDLVSVYIPPHLKHDPQVERASTLNTSSVLRRHSLPSRSRSLHPAWTSSSAASSASALSGHSSIRTEGRTRPEIKLPAKTLLWPQHRPAPMAPDAAGAGTTPPTAQVSPPVSADLVHCTHREINKYWTRKNLDIIILFLKNHLLSALDIKICCCSSLLSHYTFLPRNSPLHHGHVRLSDSHSSLTSNSEYTMVWEHRAPATVLFCSTRSPVAI